jgi:twitching motility protein PilT
VALKVVPAVADLASVFDLHQALRYVVLKEGSDLHLKVGSRPIARIHGRLEPVLEYELLEAADTERVVREMLLDPNKLSEFEQDNEVDFSYAVDGLARFRVNAFRQRGLVSIVLRTIPFAVRTVDELGLPPVIGELADEERGLILHTGTTGSGK